MPTPALPRLLEELTEIAIESGCDRKKMAMFIDRLTHDPDLFQALLRYGRVLRAIFELGQSDSGDQPH